MRMSTSPRRRSHREDGINVTRSSSTQKEQPRRSQPSRKILHRQAFVANSRTTPAYVCLFGIDFGCEHRRDETVAAARKAIFAEADAAVESSKVRGRGTGSESGDKHLFVRIMLVSAQHVALRPRSGLPPQQFSIHTPARGK